MCVSRWALPEDYGPRLLGRIGDNGELSGIKPSVRQDTRGGRCPHRTKEDVQRELPQSVNMRWGHAPRYGNGVFVQKIFPRLQGPTPAEMARRIKENAARGKRPKILSRVGFSAGTPGFLFMQASVLVSGIEDASDQKTLSVVDFDEFRMNPDGSATYLPMDALSDDPRYREYRLMRRMGATMMHAMSSAFACELMMKAICLTRKDEAKASHDLYSLYGDLPSNSRKRLEADFPQIRSVLKEGRHTFGDWRYFQSSVGEKGMRSMLNTPQTRDLEKAARVLRDEGALVGLGFVGMKAKQDLKVTEKESLYKHEFKLKVEAWENPPERDGD